jgi:myosin-crossreactive antigen
MSYNTDNYQVQGGSEWVIGGTLTIQNGAVVSGLPRVTKVALAAGTAAGGVLSWANPAGASIIVHNIAIDITTGSSVASTIDVGVAANGTTLSDTLIDGVSAATAGVFNSATHAGTNGRMSRKVASTEFVTASQASGAVAGLVGSAYITWSLA